VTNKDEYLKALTDEIRAPSQRHLDHYLKPFIVDIPSRDDWPQIIGGIKGLDGLDKENISYGSLDDPEILKIYMTYRTQK
jgi:cell filamentation protein